MKILFITGSFPPDVCGVGDYTAKLIDGLRTHSSLQVKTFHKKEWAIKNLWRYLREIKSTNSDLYHFQYPTEGYKYSFLPLFLVLFLAKKKVVTTVHELSSRNFSAYVYTQVLIFFSGSVIVSNQVEERHAAKFVLNKSKINVIPIGSNICESQYSNKPFTDRVIDVANFGHIRPMKGIEDFIDVKKSLGHGVSGAIIGQILKRYKQYFNSLEDSVFNSEITFILNQNEKDLADTLADVKIMYLPFLDGVSNRRGSLLAALQNGCVIVTTQSNHKEFNDFFDRFCFLVKSPAEARSIISQLLLGVLKPKDHQSFKDDFSWRNVIKLHINLYHQR